jgi:hypothetical protein
MSTLSANELRGRTLAIYVTAGFALIWGLSGSFALYGVWRVLALVMVLLMVGTMVAFGLRLWRHAAWQPAEAGGSRPLNPFRSPLYSAAVIGEVVAIPLVARFLSARGHAAAIICAVAIIVGLHFLPLAPAFKTHVFLWIGVAFCALGLGALLLPAQVMWGGHTLMLCQAVVGLGCALILGTSALVSFLDVRARASV